MAGVSGSLSLQLCPLPREAVQNMGGECPLQTLLLCPRMWGGWGLASLEEAVTGTQNQGVWPPAACPTWESSDSKAFLLSAQPRSEEDVPGPSSHLLALCL